MTIVGEWKEKIENRLKSYEPKDVYNYDETGLFYRALPSRILAVKGDRCIGGKLSKERLMVLVCGNMEGEFEKLLVIGKAAKPRRFKNLKISSLPVGWKSSRKAWNSAALMEQWLRAFNAKMRTQKRKMILFLDNAICHPDIKLSNVNLAWFPANTTSVAQPIDQGIIYCLKVHYQKLLRTLLAAMNTCETVSEVTKSVTVLDAITYLSEGINKVQPETVQKPDFL